MKPWGTKCDIKCDYYFQVKGQGHHANASRYLLNYSSQVVDFVIYNHIIEQGEKKCDLDIKVNDQGHSAN